MNRESAKLRVMTPERILEAMRIEIVTCGLRPGERIVENEVAQHYGASRGSVRSALAALENEGLIRMLSNGRKEVVGFSAKDALDMYELRWMIENRAIEIALEKRTTFFTPLIAVLRQIEQMSKAAQQQADWYAIDIDFHRALVQTADNSPLLKAWEINSPVMYALMRLNTTKGYRENYIQEFYPKHRTLFELLITENPDCYAYLKAHIMDAKAISSDVLEKYEREEAKTAEPSSE